MVCIHNCVFLFKSWRFTIDISLLVNSCGLHETELTNWIHHYLALKTKGEIGKFINGFFFTCNPLHPEVPCVG
jgi:hypothetical protein